MRLGVAPMNLSWPTRMCSDEISVEIAEVVNPRCGVQSEIEIPPVGKSIFYVGVKQDKVIDPKQFMKAESGPFVIVLSNIAEAENNVAVCRVTKSNAEVYAIGHTLYIMNPENLEVSIYDVNGRKIDVPQTSNSSEFLVKNEGVYLVKVGESTFEVIIK
ncbi:MAG: T9SS type A sorting domain-containing protein [Bacteroidales bacterium]|nr:T9SS type A sorting domain-containing protein [Bacteroidales bacterium]